MSGRLKVLKFGGSSLATAQRIRTVGSVISDVSATCQPVVVVSALEGVTDSLVALARCRNPEQKASLIGQVRARHLSIASQILSSDELADYSVNLDQVISTLEALLGAEADLLGKSKDEVLAAGERLSAPLIAAYVRNVGVTARAWDASQIIRTDSRFGDASVDWVGTEESIRTWYANVDCTAIVTGFIGSDYSGRTTTLGRGGSDYSAALFASALDAGVLERWTDVDGIYTHDPAKRPDARKLEIIELDPVEVEHSASRIGMHDDSLEPVARKGIPVHVRSTLAPSRRGTWLIPKSASRRKPAG